MRIFVTGGAGFIGKHLVNSLIEKKHEITIFDNFSNSQKKSLIDFKSKLVNVIEGDITKLTDITNAINGQELVIHLAAKISVPESIKNPTETFQVNVEGTKNILTACEKNQVKKLIVASSAAVYGEGAKKIKLKESSDTNPISPYGESKLKMEKEIRKFDSHHNIDCVILRFFNIYGIGQTFEYAGVVSKFLDNIRHNESLKIYGDGLQIRDFVAIEDVISSIHDAISNGKSGTYNIGSGKTTTIKELAELIISFSGKKLEIHHVDHLEGDIRNSHADISLAKKELGYLPEFGLERIKELLK